MHRIFGWYMYLPNVHIVTYFYLFSYKARYLYSFFIILDHPFSISLLLLDHGDHGLITSASSGNKCHGTVRGVSPVGTSTTLLG